MNLASFQESLQTFYRQPSQSRAEELIAWCVSTEHSQTDEIIEGNPLNVWSYAFMRLAEMYPELVRVYESSYEAATVWGKRFLVCVLLHCGDDQTAVWATAQAAADPRADLQRLASGQRQEPPPLFPINFAYQLDLWWVNFFLTGDLFVIKEIADRLQDKSDLRLRLDRWLSRRGPLAWLFRRRRSRAKERLHQEFGIVCDQTRVSNHEDLDCLCLQEDSIGDVRFVPFAGVASALPIRLPFRVRYSIGVKMLAKWSLFSNAQQHPVIRQWCIDAASQVDRRSEATLNQSLALIDIVANLYAAEGNESEALRFARWFVEVDPLSRRLQRMVSDLETDRTLNELLAQGSPELKCRAMNSNEIGELIRDCVTQTLAAESYTTIRRVSFQEDAGKEEAEWRLVFENPDRAFVYQCWGEVADAWYMIDGAIYHRLFLIAQVPQPRHSGVLDVIQHLLVETVLDDLPNLQVVQCGEDATDNRYFVLRGRLEDVPALTTEFAAGPQGDYAVDVWIDQSCQRAPRLAKVTLKADFVEFEQVFAGYDATRVSMEDFA